MSTHATDPPPTRDELISDIRYYEELAQKTEVQRDRMPETDPDRRQIANLAAWYRASADRLRLKLKMQEATRRDSTA